MSGLETPAPVTTLPLSGGAELPLVGLGTWPMDDATAARVVLEALELGTA